MKCEDIECDPNRIANDINYEKEDKNMLLLVSQKSYEIIKEANLILGKEYSDTIFQAISPCQAFGYLYDVST